MTFNESFDNIDSVISKILSNTGVRDCDKNRWHINAWLMKHVPRDIPGIVPTYSPQQAEKAVKQGTRAILIGLARHQRREAYREYLQSWDWADRSKRCRERDCNQCKFCGQKCESVAHLTYKYGWACPLWCLACTCTHCHQVLDSWRFHN